MGVAGREKELRLKEVAMDRWQDMGISVVVIKAQLSTLCDTHAKWSLD